MTNTKVLIFFLLPCLSVVEPTTRTIYPFEAEARLITDPIVNGAVALEDFIGDIVQPLITPQFSGEKPKESYDAAPPAPAKIPCGDYGSKRRSLIVGALAGDKGKDDCGVYKATNEGLDNTEETCEYVHETVFVTKYKTECSKTYSTQCQTSYRTECTESLNRECRMEYQNICSGGHGGGQGSYGVGATCQQVPKQV